jgi:hypothetical protein
MPRLCSNSIILRGYVSLLRALRHCSRSHTLNHHYRRSSLCLEKQKFTNMIVSIDSTPSFDLFRNDFKQTRDAYCKEMKTRPSCNEKASTVEYDLVSPNDPSKPDRSHTIMVEVTHSELLEEVPGSEEKRPSKACVDKMLQVER